jgi:hypothetical protein
MSKIKTVGKVILGGVIVLGIAGLVAANLYTGNVLVACSLMMAVAMFWG